MSEVIYHYGVKGQKWGVRRYQNEDGSFTSAGKKRYDKDVKKIRKTVVSASKDLDSYYLDLQKQNRYFNPNTGNSIQIYNKKLRDKAMKSSKKVDDLLYELEKKYGTATVIPEIDYETGKRYVDVFLGQNNEKIYLDQ